MSAVQRPIFQFMFLLAALMFNQWFLNESLRKLLYTFRMIDSAKFSPFINRIPKIFSQRNTVPRWAVKDCSFWPCAICRCVNLCVRVFVYVPNFTVQHHSCRSIVAGVLMSSKWDWFDNFRVSQLFLRIIKFIIISQQLSESESSNIFGQSCTQTRMRNETHLKIYELLRL